MKIGDGSQNSRNLTKINREIAEIGDGSQNEFCNSKEKLIMGSSSFLNKSRKLI